MIEHANAPTTEQTIHRYMGIWNERNAERRRAVIDELFAERCDYVDPKVAARGPAELDAFIGAVQTHYPGVVFSVASAIDAHHEQARFTWHAAAPGVPEPVAIGFDVVVFENGRIRSVYGFLDKSP